MPPSYSRILPGRMSTPLIFMGLAFDGLNFECAGRTTRSPRSWQCKREQPIAQAMKGHSILAIAAAVAAIVTPAASAWAQAPIATIERGSYVCELPGDASGRAGREQPAENFSILSASRYSSAQGSGT